jgi:hypothetical protein
VALAAIWLAAGLTALAIGLWLRPALVPVLISPLALGYGWIWARVAVTGRRQEWPPWRRRGDTEAPPASRPPPSDDGR